MNCRDVKIEAVLPLFSGVLGALILCAIIGASVFGIDIRSLEAAEVTAAPPPQEAETEDLARLFTAAPKEAADSIMECYRHPEYRQWVIDFFTGLCGSREIAEVILENAYSFDVPPSLAFALSWEESRFNPRAVNSNNANGSIDRGLFQLNSLSFPQLGSGDVFDININVRYGIGHLRHCLDTVGFEIAALAMYNAGEYRIRNTGTPKVTLDYVHRILENRDKIESRFLEDLAKEEEDRNTGPQPSFVSSGNRSYFNPMRIISASPL